MTEDDSRTRVELAALAARLDTVEAVQAITDLKARYGALADARLAGGAPVPPEELRRVCRRIAALFTEDATWDGGPVLGTAVGRDAIAERLSRSTLRFSRHFFLTPRLEVDGDRARGRWDVLAPCIGRDGRSYWMCGTEDDEYRRHQGRWLHASMRMTTVFFSPAGTSFDDALERTAVPTERGASDEDRR